MKAKLSAPMPFSAASRMVSRRLQATHSGGWGFWTGLGTTLRGGMVTNRPSTPPKGVSVMQRMATSSPSSQASRLVVAVDAEPAQLGLGRRLARAELHPAPGDQVQHGDALGDPGRVVVARRRLDDAVADAACAGALAGRGQEDLGRAECEYSSKKWCSTSHRYCDPEAVGQLDLVQGVGDQLLLAGVAPGPGQLVLVEDAELHRVAPPVAGRPVTPRPTVARHGTSGSGSPIGPSSRTTEPRREHLVHDVVGVGPAGQSPARSRP